MTDQELDIVVTATRTIPPEQRAAFLAALGYALEHSSDSGDGVVARAINSVRRNLFGPTFKMTMVLR